MNFYCIRIAKEAQEAREEQKPVYLLSRSEHKNPIFDGITNAEALMGK